MLLFLLVFLFLVAMVFLLLFLVAIAFLTMAFLLLLLVAMAFLLVSSLPPIVFIMGGRLGQLPFIQRAHPFTLLMGGRSPPIILILGGLKCIALELLLSLTPSYRLS